MKTSTALKTSRNVVEIASAPSGDQSADANDQADEGDVPNANRSTRG